MPGSVHAIVLDVDGTLVDSNDAHARAWVDAFADEGVAVDYERVRRTIGMGGDKLMPRVSGISEDSPQGARISARRAEIFTSRYLPHLRSFPHVAQLVERFARDGITIVVASSAKEDELRSLLDKAGISHLIEAQTSSDDAEESKPAPDIVEAALKRSGASRDAVIMLGDTPYDVEAALRAGIAIVGVECGGWGRQDLRGAVEVYADPGDLLARYNSSVFARLSRSARRSRPENGQPGAGGRSVAEGAAETRWAFGARLVLVGMVMVIWALARQRQRRARANKERDDRRHPGLGPRERAELRHLIARTS